MKLVLFLLILYLIWTECRGARRAKKKLKEDISNIENNPDIFKEFRNLKISNNADVKNENTERLISFFLGHGGTYESVRGVASNKNIIESDHAPHYSILEYVHKIDELPESNIKKALKNRQILETKLASDPGYQNNVNRMTELKTKISELKQKVDKLFPTNRWNAKFRKPYYKNIEGIAKSTSKLETLKETLASKAANVDITKEKGEIKILEEKIITLLAQNTQLRREAKAKAGIDEVDKQLTDYEVEYQTIEKNNAELSKNLDKLNDNIKNAMGVLSIPYYIHRVFPSTGQGGIDIEIQSLKNDDAEKAEKVKNEYEDFWRQDMDTAIRKGYMKVSDEFAEKTSEGEFKYLDGKKVYNYDAVWEHNLENVLKAVEINRQTNKRAAKKSSKSKTKKSNKKKEASTVTVNEFLHRVHLSYAKKFMTTAIYFVKTPKKGYMQLMELYINEYKLYMKNEFDNYKLGISSLLEANKQIGWITNDEISSIKLKYEIPEDTAGSQMTREWYEVEDSVKSKSAKSSNLLLQNTAPESPSIGAGASTVCSPSTRRKRSASGNCIFFSNSKNTDTGIDTKKGVKPNLNDDGLPRPKINLPSDADTSSIDSKRLTNFLKDLDGGDIESVRTKDAVLEFASRNADKLTGTPEEIAKAKARLKQEGLNSHLDKAVLGNKLLRGNNAGDIPAKAVTKYKKLKISSGKLAEKLSKFTKGSSKLSNPYGKIMLAKSFVTAVRHNDNETLALLFGRIGLEAALSGVTEYGKRIGKKATTKFMKHFGKNFLGKLAGPVGAIADIGLNTYSIIKSVDELNNPHASKYDRNDAIADIIADSIDIAVTTAEAVLSLVFSPLAPFFAAVAFSINLVTTIVVGFYKAANHVDRINEQIPLLDFEMGREYWRYIIGRNTSGYIEELIDTKRANNIAVDMTVQFLQNNPDFIGRVFPSRTLFQPGASCWLEGLKCAKILVLISGKCHDWRWLSDCAGYSGYCEGELSNWKCESASAVSFDYDVIIGNRDDWELRCKCGSEPPPVWGYEIPDSVVNFRYKQKVYLQRAAPDFAVPDGFTYLSKPSSLNDEGERVSQNVKEWAYLSKGAIGVTRSNSQGKFMLYDLGDGNDTVYLDTSERVDNMFVVKDGYKIYEGNAGDDTFLLDGPCDNLRGWLDGKGYKSHGNSLVLGPNCYPGETIEVDLPRGSVCLGNNYILYFLRIQRLIGRQKKTDIVRASCTTKLIVGSGGRSASDPDKIYLPESCSSQTELTVAVEGSQTIDARSFAGKVFVLLQEAGLSFYAKVPSSLPNGALLFKFQESVGKLTSARINANEGTIELQFGRAGSATFDIYRVSTTAHQTSCSSSQTSSIKNPIQIIITENSKFNRQLSFDLKPPGQLQASHVLDKESGSRIQGYDFMDNVFHLKSGQWHVTGGRGRMNQFILKSTQFSGTIDGTTPSQSTLLLSDDIDFNYYPLRIDFNLEEIHVGDVVLRNIQSFVGRESYTELVVASCTTKYLELGGRARDILTIRNTSNCSPEVRISAKGKLKVDDRKLSGATVIEAGFGYFDLCVGKRSGEPLDLQVNNFGGGDMTLLLNIPISTLSTATTTNLNIGGDVGGNVLIQGGFPNVYFDEDHNIKSALSLNEHGKFTAFHELKVENSFEYLPKLRKGSNFLPNVFKLENGKKWKVDGGDDGDVFYLVGNRFSGSIDGMGGRNQLVIGDSILGQLEIRQSDLFVGDRDRDRSQQYALALSNIQEIHGRIGQSEKVEIGCDTLYLALNGGNPRQPDQIIIPESFSRRSSKLNLTISAVGITQLKTASSLLGGKVDTYLSTDSNDQLQFKANLQVSSNTVFNFPIQVLSYKLTSNQVNIKTTEDGKSVESIQFKLNLMGDGNFLDFSMNYQNGTYLPQNVNWMFVDENFNSNGNIFINIAAGELNVLHVLKKTEGDPDSKEKVIRRGSVGAKNIFRLHAGFWDAFGGAFDDSFILNENGFLGQIHGMQGVNSLILTETLSASSIEVDLLRNTVKLMEKNKVKETITAKSIQIVGGRKGKQEKVNCDCHTRLVMLEGGGTGKYEKDEIHIPHRPCQTEMETAFVVTDSTIVENLAMRGNFTYHIRAVQLLSWDIKYIATTETNHAIKLEMGLEKVKAIHVIMNDEKEESRSQSLWLIFNDGGIKTFPLNFKNLPTFQIGSGPELMAEILIPKEEDGIIKSSIIARTPFSGVINGWNGIENGIVVKTSSSLQGIFGGDKDDTILLSEVESVSVINAGAGLGGLQLSDELHRGLDMEVDFQLAKISFVEDHSDFVTVVHGIHSFVGREHSFERVVLGCQTKSVKWADEVSIRNWKCGYKVKIEVGDSTRVIFEEEVKFPEEDDDETKVEEADTDDDDESEEENYDDEFDEEEDNQPSYLEESTFHYHFASIRSFDIEVGTFESLLDTRHIFYLNFTLANLTSIRFALNESRLIYSTVHDPSLEYSHLVGELEITDLFYSQPEFMTTEGFLLRITRYGEILAVLGSVEETFELDFIHNEVIPRLTAHAERLGISFMVETANDFIYTGCPLQEEVDLLSNKENSTSHLVGWNGTTYEILDLNNDTWIYPLKAQEPDSIHVIDMTSIVSQIRNQTGHKYIPEVRERNGTNLEIVMTNWTDTYPASVIIANGTELGKSVRILLNSIAMEIMPDIPYAHDRSKRSPETEWKIKPRPIIIPEGYTYILSSEDLEDGVEIKRAGDDLENSRSLSYGRDNSDLVITSINTEDDTPEMERYTSFVIFDYYDPGQEQQLKFKEGNESNDGTGSVKTITNIQVNFGMETVKITSNEPILTDETGEEVQVLPYKEIVENVENQILKEISDIQSLYKVSWAVKIGSIPLCRYLWWGAFWIVTMALSIFIWVFFRKKSDQMIYHLKKRQDNYNKGRYTAKENKKPIGSSFISRTWKWMLGKDKTKTYEVKKASKYGSDKSFGKEIELIPMNEQPHSGENSIESLENLEIYEEPMLVSKKSLDDCSSEIIS